MGGDGSEDIAKGNVSEGIAKRSTSEDIVYVRSGDRIRLEHVLTRRNLHSHAHPGPVTRKHNQVTCYGNEGHGDIHDEWTIVLEDGRNGDPISRISSRFRLLHGYAGHPPTCALHSDGTQLPKWGFEQVRMPERAFTTRTYITHTHTHTYTHSLR